MPFIVFEGLDRAGKSTQVRRLCEHLRSQGKSVTVYRFPERDARATGDVLSRYLRGDVNMSAEVAHLLFAANRREVMPAIEDALESHDYVICDRYWYSGAAYSHAKGVDIGLCLGADVGLRRPDAILHLESAPEILAQRAEYGQERHDDVEFQRKVWRSYGLVYDEMRRRERDRTGVYTPATRIIHIDASAAMDAITEGIRKMVEDIQK